MADTPTFARRDLTLANLALRSFREADAGPINLFAGDARVATMTTSIPHPYPPGAADAFIAAARAGRLSEHVWAIDASPGGGPEFVGVVSFREGSGEIGYWIGPPFWGTGHATQAVTALVGHLMDEVGLNEVRAHVLFDNSASQKVLKKTGFRQAGERWLFSVARGMEVPALCFGLDAAAWHARA